MTEDTLFLEALAKPPSERAAFLDAACASRPELRAAVEARLAAHEAAGKIDAGRNPTVPFATVSQTPALADSEPASIAAYQPRADPDLVIAGRYRLVEKIGAGGMGEVWIADQTEPVKRKVALKLIKAGMDSKAVLQRFEQERQALAMMDHPNIAKVLDGGLTPDRRPFFVMELVNGLPLTRFCDENQLGIRERLELFVTICQAVQHAHQKGIIHRDLKPGNILVARIDGRPVAKVIDFGVAKATSGRLLDESLSTQLGAVIGTLEYMSPEQAGVSGEDIDTRADIYSLGVILYELLTGLRPIDAKRLKKAALLEMVRIIKEEEPSKPSTRVSTDDSAPSMAAVRHTEPKKLAALLRGELDWVVMKCLEKQRERRYETANGLARDIQRYLANEVVEARPPSAGYRMRKFVSRNKGRVVAASLIALALIAGIIGTTLGLIEAQTQRDEADGARASAVAEAKAKDEARQAEEIQRKNAERANQQAMEALKLFTDELMIKIIGNKDKLTDAEKSILRSAQKQWEVFAQSKGDSPEARVIRAEGAAELAIVQHKLGLDIEAEANDRAALRLRASLAAEFPGVPLYRLKQGMSQQNLGALLRGAGNRAEAEASFKSAADTFAKLAADFPEEPIYRERLAWALLSLGTAQRSRADWAAAEKQYREALRVQAKLAADNPKYASYRNDQSNSHWALAFALKRSGKLTESEAEYRQALALKQSLVADFPIETTYRFDSANIARELGTFLYDNGKLAEGAKLFPESIGELEKLVSEFPSLPVYRYSLSQAQRDYGKVLGMLSNRVEGADQFKQAITRGEKLVRDQPTNLPYQHSLGLSYFYFADLLSAGGNPADGLDWYGKAIRTLTAVYEQDRLATLTQSALYKCHQARARTHSRLGKHADALADWDSALQIAPLDQRDFLRVQRTDARLRSGQAAEAMAEVAELAKVESANPNRCYDIACLYAIASAKVAGKKDEYAERAVDFLRKAVSLGYKNAPHMARDDDLDALRGRADFKKLLAELQKKTSSPPKKQP